MFGLERNECASRIDTSFHPIAGKPRVRNCEGGGRGFVLIMSSIFPGAASSAWTGTRGKIEHSHVETACVGRPGQALHLCKARPRPSQRRLSLTARLLRRATRLSSESRANARPFGGEDSVRTGQVRSAIRKRLSASRLLDCPHLLSPRSSFLSSSRLHSTPDSSLSG
jgi:hypothetical protein